MLVIYGHTVDNLIVIYWANRAIIVIVITGYSLDRLCYYINGAGAHRKCARYIMGILAANCASIYGIARSILLLVIYGAYRSRIVLVYYWAYSLENGELLRLYTRIRARYCVVILGSSPIIVLVIYGNTRAILLLVIYWAYSTRIVLVIILGIPSIIVLVIYWAYSLDNCASYILGILAR